MRVNTINVPGNSNFSLSYSLRFLLNDLNGHVHFHLQVCMITCTYAIAPSKQKKKRPCRNIVRVHHDKFGINKCGKAEWKITRLTQMVVTQTSGHVYVFLYHTCVRKYESKQRTTAVTGASSLLLLQKYQII